MGRYPDNLAWIASFFVSVPADTLRATVLLPTPHAPQGFLQLSVPRGISMGGLHLPVMEGWSLQCPDTARDGAIIRVVGNSRRDPSGSSMGTTGTSLVQTSFPKAKRKQVIFDKDLAGADPPAVECLMVPTPMGRRQVPWCHQPNETLRLSQAIPPAATPSSCRPGGVSVASHSPCYGYGDRRCLYWRRVSPKSQTRSPKLFTLNPEPQTLKL